MYAIRSYYGGDIRNSGFEFVLSWNDQVGGFKYGATLTGAYNKNEVTKLANAEGIITGSANPLSQGTSYVSRVDRITSYNVCYTKLLRET